MKKTIDESSRDDLKKYLRKQYNIIKGSKRRHFYFEGDEEIIKKFNNKCKNEKNILHTELVPAPIIGNIYEGKIFICSLNPGYNENDIKIEKRNKYFPQYKEIIINQLNQSEHSKKNKMFFLTEKNCEVAGARYWRQKFSQRDIKKSLVYRIQKEFEKNGTILEKEDIFVFLSKIVVTLELFPYHSEKMDKHLLKQDEYNFKSVELMRNYVHNYLIPSAKEEKCLVIFLRSFKEWGYNKSYNRGNVIINKGNKMNPSFDVNGNIGERMLKYIKKITDDFKTIKI